MPQDPQLFGGSVRENIAYGQLDATPEEIERVAIARAVLHYIAVSKFGGEAGQGRRDLLQGLNRFVVIRAANLA